MKALFRRKTILGITALAMLLAPLGVLALAAPMMMLPLPFRITSAEVVVTGQVQSVEEKATFSKKDGVEYQVATLKIENSLKGVKDVTHIRVAWPAPPKPQVNPVDPNVPVRPIRPRQGGMNLQKDQEVLLLLKKHDTESFYVAADFMPVVYKTGNPNFKNDLAEAERSIKVMADPIAALKSKEADERLLAVALQMRKYQQQRTPNAAKEPINKEESKLILQTLAEADWSDAAANRTLTSSMTQPRNLFLQMRLMPADGWVQPRPDPKNPANYQKDLDAAAKKWLTENQEKYVIQRFVEGK